MDVKEVITSQYHASLEMLNRAACSQSKEIVLSFGP
jgi:hypothetical protein